MTAEPKRKQVSVIGRVVSDKMDKTIKVRVERLVKHPRVGKYIRRRIDYFAHDESNAASEGDRVEIIETHPISRRKRWRLRKVLQQEPSS